MYVISLAVANANQLFCGCLTELETIFTSYSYWDIHISPVCHPEGGLQLSHFEYKLIQRHEKNVVCPYNQFLYIIS